MHMTPQDEDLPFRLRGTVKRIEKASQRARRKRRVRSSVTPPPSRGSSEAGDAEMLQPQNDQDSLHTPPASANGDSPVLKYEGSWSLTRNLLQHKPQGLELTMVCDYNRICSRAIVTTVVWGWPQAHNGIDSSTTQYQRI
jgi:hypothetical protein